MSVSPDFANQLQIDFAPAPQGSCWTDAQLSELARRMRITLPQNQPQKMIPCISDQSNNLASMDGQNCLYVPAGNLYRDQQDWLVATPTNIVFSGFPSTFDPTTDGFWHEVIFDPSDYVAGRVSLVSITDTAVTYAVSHASANVTILFFMVQLAVAPQPA